MTGDSTGDDDDDGHDKTAALGAFDTQTQAPRLAASERNSRRAGRCTAGPAVPLEQRAAANAWLCACGGHGRRAWFGRGCACDVFFFWCHGCGECGTSVANVVGVAADAHIIVLAGVSSQHQSGQA